MILHTVQPDYAALADDWEEPFLPCVLRDMWTYGDHIERREVDRLLATQRQNMIRDQRDLFNFD